MLLVTFDQHGYDGQVVVHFQNSAFLRSNLADPSFFFQGFDETVDENDPFGSALRSG
jgi:hypothetical protein